MTQQHHDPTAPKLHGWEVHIQRVMDWIRDHPREVLSTLGGALLLGLLLAGLFEWRDRAETAAQIEFARVEREFAHAMGADPGRGQLFAEPANPDQAKQAREAALAGFEGLIEEHPGSRAAALGQTRAAELELDLERADAALTRLQAFAGSADEADPMRGVAFRLVAHIHEERGNSLGAAEAYALGGDVETYPDRAWLWMAAGDNFERAGEPDRAIQAFQEGLAIDAVLGERLRVVERLTALERRAIPAETGETTGAAPTRLDAGADAASELLETAPDPPASAPSGSDKKHSVK